MPEAVEPQEVQKESVLSKIKALAKRFAAPVLGVVGAVTVITVLNHDFRLRELEDGEVFALELDAPNEDDPVLEAEVVEDDQEG